MTQEYVASHWTVFSAIPHVPAGAIGEAPLRWVIKNSLTGAPANLPTIPLDRQQLRALCTSPDTDVLYGYICIMAWGGQRYTHPAKVWSHRQALKPLLERVREGGLSRAQAFQLFTGASAIPHLGPSYFTKLLYFFSPQPDCYIMDQYTEKSVGLLLGYPLMRQDKSAKSLANKSENYQAYCEEVDRMAALCKVPGNDLEEMLMSGKNRPWRLYLNDAWEKCQLPRYKAAEMKRHYPHLY